MRSRAPLLSLVPPCTLGLNLDLPQVLPTPPLARTIRQALLPQP